MNKEIKKIHLDSIDCSRIGFGCAPVMGSIGKQESLLAMDVAFDHGINYFDVARSYGFGEAESVLGSFCKNKRDKVVLATKFGIAPSKLGSYLKYLKPIVRKVRNNTGISKKAFKNTSEKMLTRIDFTFKNAKLSIEKSLKELKTDYIDIVLLHEPLPGFLFDDDIYLYFNDLRSKGVIKKWGVASFYDDLDETLTVLKYDPDIIQCNNSFFSPKSIQRSVDIALFFSPFGGQYFSLLFDYLSDDKDFIFRIKKLYCMDLELYLPRILLEYLIQFYDNSIVLCSMFSRQHIINNADILNQLSFDKEEFLLLQHKISSFYKTI